MPAQAPIPSSLLRFSLKARRLRAEPTFGRGMRRFIVIIMLAVAIIATAQLPASASAGASRVFIVQGHGWGHGRGMGQYGARALAAAGTPWYRILPKYYTDIHYVKTAPGQRISVLLSHAKSVVVKGDSRALIVTGGKRVAWTK